MRTFDPWDYSQDTGIVISDEQQSILNKAIELLSPLFTDETPAYIHYFMEDETGDDACVEVCDNENCVAEYLKNNPGLIAETSQDDGDHERISTCEICGCYLNSQLTWIDTEFDYLEAEVKTSGQIKEEAFVIHSVFSAYPSCDEKINPYERHQAKMGNTEPLNNVLMRMEAHVSRVIAYAELVINILST